MASPIGSALPQVRQRVAFRRHRARPLRGFLPPLVNPRRVALEPADAADDERVRPVHPRRSQGVSGQRRATTNRTGRRGTASSGRSARSSGGGANTADAWARALSRAMAAARVRISIGFGQNRSVFAQETQAARRSSDGVGRGEGVDAQLLGLRAVIERQREAFRARRMGSAMVKPCGSVVNGCRVVCPHAHGRDGALRGRLPVEAGAVATVAPNASSKCAGQNASALSPEPPWRVGHDGLDERLQLRRVAAVALLPLRPEVFRDAQPGTAGSPSRGGQFLR